tara:strand:- start:2540 stop:2782 length:243 start_codon:yes stop_codon:yes gene_type:complete
MKAISTTKARENLFQLVKEVAINHEPIQVHGKQGAVVMVAQEDWESIEETLFIDSIPGLGDSIIEGLQTPESDCFDKIEW